MELIIPQDLKQGDRIQIGITRVNGRAIDLEVDEGGATRAEHIGCDGMQAEDAACRDDTVDDAPEMEAVHAPIVEANGAGNGLLVSPRNDNLLPRDRQLLWKYEAGAFDPKQYNDWAAEHRRRRPQTPGKRRFGNGGSQLDITHPHLAPLMSADGNLLFKLTPDAYDSHCHIRPVSSELALNPYTSLGGMYWLRARVRIPAEAMGWAEKCNWCVVVQHWQAPRRNPPFALLIKRGQWCVQQYASPHDIPADNQSWTINGRLDRSRDDLKPIDDQWHDLVIAYRPSLGTDGVSMVWMDSEMLYLWQGPNCLKRPDGRGTMLTLGNYTSRAGAVPESVVEVNRIEYARG